MRPVLAPLLQIGAGVRRGYLCAAGQIL